MEQQKISVTTDGEIDVSEIGEVFFTTLLNRIIEISHQKQSAQQQSTDKR